MGFAVTGRTRTPKKQRVCTSALLLCMSQEGQNCGCSHLEENIHVMAAKNSARRAAPCTGCSTARAGDPSSPQAPGITLVFTTELRPGKRGCQSPALLRCS